MSSASFKSPQQQVADAKKKGIQLLEEDEDTTPMWKEMPVLFAGIGAASAVLIFQAINYRRYKRNKMPTSIFMQQTRVYAQGTMVALLMFAAGYNIFNTMWNKKKE